MKYTMILVAAFLIAGCNFGKPSGPPPSTACEEDSLVKMKLLESNSDRIRLLETQVAEWKAGKRYENRTMQAADNARLREDSIRLSRDENALSSDEKKKQTDKEKEEGK